MSWSVFNMCRLVVAVIFISFISCVFAGDVTTATPPAAPTCTKAERDEGKKNMTSCFGAIVKHTFKKTVGICTTIEDLQNNIKTFYKKLNDKCNIPLAVVDSTKFFNFMKFSLDNFTDVYDSGEVNLVKCVKETEKELSTCLKTEVGTVSNKTSSWYQKQDLQFNNVSCTKGLNTKKCVHNVLKDHKSCSQKTLDYIDNLFDFIQKLCPQETPPKSDKNGAATTSLMTSLLVTIVSTTILECW